VTSIEAALRRILADLQEARVSCALVGGLAVSARSEPRFTRDADLAVAVANDSEAEALVHLLSGAGYAVDAVVEQEATGRLATARLRRAGSARVPVIDLLFASSGIEPEVVAASQPLELLPTVTIPVACTGHLVALKVLSRDDVRRPQDAADLRALLRVSSPADLELAREAVALITARGYDRRRDLASDLQRLIAEHL
jgi:predicted nucleotidyltransferase